MKIISFLPSVQNDKQSIFTNIFCHELKAIPENEMAF